MVVVCGTLTPAKRFTLSTSFFVLKISIITHRRTFFGSAMDIGCVVESDEKDRESVASSQVSHLIRGPYAKANSYACSLRDDMSDVYSSMSAMGDDIVFKVPNITS